LTGGPLEAQVELLLLQLEHFVIHLVDGHRLDVGCFHRHAYSLMRSTKRVLIGSLAAASASDSLATATGTPAISNSMRPGLPRPPQIPARPCPSRCALRAASSTPARPGTPGSRPGRRASCCA